MSGSGAGCFTSITHVGDQCVVKTGHGTRTIRVGETYPSLKGPSKVGTPRTEAKVISIAKIGDDIVITTMAPGAANTRHKLAKRFATDYVPLVPLPTSAPTKPQRWGEEFIAQALSKIEARLEALENYITSPKNAEEEEGEGEEEEEEEVEGRWIPGEKVIRSRSGGILVFSGRGGEDPPSPGEILNIQDDSWEVFNRVPCPDSTKWGAALRHVRTQVTSFDVWSKEK